MSSLPAFKYSHHTLVFFPLENREIFERHHLRDDPSNQSSRYLHGRPGGFIFLRWLQNHPSTPDAVVGLFASIDRPQELVVIKKLTSILRTATAADPGVPMAAEIEQCTLSKTDRWVRRRLPLFDENMGPTPFPKMHAFQVHHTGFAVAGNDPDAARRQNADITIIYKYYNGGTLHNFYMKYKEAGRKVPEGFIWHFISQVCRAFSFLHTGTIPSKEYNLINQHDIGMTGVTVNVAGKTERTWKPICHMDMHMSNIWLHYPTDEEKKADPQLEQFTDAFPQIILGDFGYSFQAENDRPDMLGRDENLEIPEPETMRDKTDLAAALWHLLKLQATEAERDAAVRRNAYTKTPFDPADLFDLGDFMPKNYSRDLAIVWDVFRTLRALDINDEYYHNLRRITEDDWKRMPLNNFTYGTMIAMADRFLDNHVGSGQEESVRWAQPRNADMPYHSLGRNPKEHRWDWGRVDGHLMRVKDTHFWAYRQASPACVKTRQAHIVGAGRLEQELDRVEFGRPPKPPAPPKPAAPPPPPPPPAAAPPGSQDSLPDYEVFEEEENAAAAAQVQAQRVAVVQQQQRVYPSPWIDWIAEEDRERERHQQRVYAQKCRARGLV